MQLPATVTFDAALSQPVKSTILHNTLIKALENGSTIPHLQPQPNKSLTAPGSVATPTTNLLSTKYPLRMLVVDDNSINQKVLLSLLQRIGYTADLAGDGIEACKAVDKKPYDLVFMDVQMPLMDGLEATRSIRNNKSLPAKSHQPIIVALTARTMPGDRELCLEAGMDDFLSKPVRSESLHAIIESWGIKVHGLAKETVPPQTPPPAPVLPGAVVSPPVSVKEDELPIVDVERVMEFASGDPEGVKELANLYIEQTLSSLSKLKSAILANNIKEVQHLAHRTGGASATCGMMRIAKTFKSMELMASGGSLAGALTLQGQVEREFNEIRNFLDNFQPAG